MHHGFPIRIGGLVGLLLLAAISGEPLMLVANGADWPDKAQRGPFLCQAAFPMGEIEPALRQLDALSGDIQSRLGITAAPNGPIHVYLFADAASHQAYLQRYFPQVQHRRALTIRVQTMAMIFVQRGPQLAVDLRHEGAHALMQSAIPNLPLWLDEGLALYFEQSARDAEDSPNKGGNKPPDVSLVVLQNLEQHADWQQFAPPDYAAAGVWTRALLDGPQDVRAELGAYLNDLRRGPSQFPMSVRLQSLGKHAISTQLIGSAVR